MTNEFKFTEEQFAEFMNKIQGILPQVTKAEDRPEVSQDFEKYAAESSPTILPEDTPLLRAFLSLEQEKQAVTHGKNELSAIRDIIKDSIDFMLAEIEAEFPTYKEVMKKDVELEFEEAKKKVNEIIQLTDRLLTKGINGEAIKNADPEMMQYFENQRELLLRKLYRKYEE